MNNEATGALIRELRKQKNLTQKQLAQQLHVTDQAVSKWERGLCAPDVALLEPLARALDTTVLALISGAAAPEAAEPAHTQVESAVKEVIQYSERQIAQTRKRAARSRLLTAAVCFLLVLLALPAANGLLFGDGFAWRCVPAWLCASRSAQALEAYDQAGIERYIANADGLFDTLAALKEQGVVIRQARVDPGRTRLDDMFMFIEMELTVQQGRLTYLFTCRGTWRHGKVEWMQILPLEEGYDGPGWIPVLSEALATYDPG